MNSGYTLTFANSGSDDFNENREEVELVSSAQNTHTRPVSKEAYTAIQDLQNGTMSSRDAQSILREEGIAPFFLKGKIIGQVSRTRTPVAKKEESKGVITKKRKQKAKATKKASKKRKMRKMKLRDNNPLMVPFNVSINSGKSGECVYRGIKPEGKSVYPGQETRKYTGTTTDDLINYCDEIERPLVLYDITGRIFYNNDYPSLKNYPKVVGLCHNEHLYLGKKSIHLNTETVYTEPEAGYIEYSRGNNIITSGVHRQKDEEFVELSIELGSFNCATRILLKNGIKALGYSKSSDIEVGFTIDCNKCYYSTATNPEYIKWYGIFNIFDEFKKYNGEVLTEYSFYTVKCDATKYGITSNVVGGRTLLALISLGVSLEITSVLTPGSKKLWEHSVIASAFSTDHKAFNKYNGMCGKTEANGSTTIRITNGRERDWLLKDHTDFSVSQFDPEIITRSFSFEKVSGLLHRYLAVIDAGCARVLNTIRSIGKEVLKIKTDSLTYANSVPVPIGWKIEEFKRSSYTSNGNTYHIKLDEVKYTRNICYLGAPGTGKSYTVKNEHNYDYAAAFTNKAALNCCSETVKGQTLHTLFNLQSTKKFNYLQDKTVWIDEISMIPRWIWAYILEAYLNLNTTFIFSGDFNQTSPVGEQPLRVIPFLGEVITLSIDHRNCNEIIKLREDILNNEKIEVEYSKTEYPLTNIAFTNSKVAEINAAVVLQNGIEWGSVGSKVIAKETIKSFGIVKNKNYLIEEGSTILGIPFDTISNKFEWGYCNTIHKSQGDTITDVLGIHEFSGMSKEIKYTAITRACIYSNIRFYK